MDNGRGKGAERLGAGYEARVPHIRELGMHAVAVGAEGVVMCQPYQERLVGNPETGVLHGGVVTTLIDSACGLAVLAAMDSPGPIATLDLRIDYLKPAAPGKDLLATAHCYKLTRHIAFVRATAHHEDADDPVAAAQATFIIKASGGGLEADRRGA